MLTIIAELATNHGGDLAVARDLISACADAGVDVVKTQCYRIDHLRKDDPQYAWFTQAELTRTGHEQLRLHAEACGVGYLTTIYHPDLIPFVRHDLGLRHVKIGSGEGGTTLAQQCVAAGFHRVYRSTPPFAIPAPHARIVEFHAVPLYPTPMDQAGLARLYDPLIQGYSDHTVGMGACVASVPLVRFIEKHVSFVGRGRRCVWDADPWMFRRLRDAADAWDKLLLMPSADAMRGARERFEGRWGAS